MKVIAPFFSSILGEIRLQFDTPFHQEHGKNSSIRPRNVGEVPAVLPRRPRILPAGPRSLCGDTPSRCLALSRKVAIDDVRFAFVGQVQRFRQSHAGEIPDRN